MAVIFLGQKENGNRGKEKLGLIGNNSQISVNPAIK
jgi:hypothetical protein